MTPRARSIVGLVAIALSWAACVPKTPVAVSAGPKFPGYPNPDIPPAVRATAEVRERHADAWRRLQAGDIRAASREFSDIIKRSPDFYPSQTGLGFVYLADRQPKQASARFAAAIAVNDRYLPAWLGEIDAELASNRDPEAIAAMERVLALDPTREAVRSRLELVKFRRVQALIESGRRARAGGKLDDARQLLQQALDLSPESAAILHELALADTAADDLEAAETHARRAAQLDPNDADAQAALAATLELRKKYREAAAALTKAIAIDARPEWRAHLKTLRDNADLAALPPEFGEIAHADTITRAQTAAYIGIKLQTLVAAAPKRVIAVATDVRTHWAAPWILPVTQAGVMEIFANHTFQPATTVRRSDLAQIVAVLVGLAGAGHPTDLVRWRAARPRFLDLTPTHLLYRPAAIAVAAGAMTADADGRFLPTRPATGADLVSAVTRVDQLTR